ncbi:DUF1508 domain-containing protein [Companilactobacillus metriopterae]|uniref:DUF1508 domain-containing protein n=1 Tax=Companilactobacillus metriopterae TaxID=1909267 RepID=UPI00100B49F5
MYFLIIKSSINEKFYFMIMSESQEIIAKSESYKDKKSLLEDISYIKNNIYETSEVLDISNFDK